MKNTKFNFIILFCCLIILLIIIPAFAKESSLRVTESIDSLITDLQSYIPNRMHDADVPGLAIALIRDGEIVWQEGFGAVNTITKKSVTSGTLFEVASNSKVVTAYAAMRLVEQGKLDLDAPAASYLHHPYIKTSEYSNKITIRHLLSHSSGLPHQPFSRNVPMFEPGTDYSYSGHGFSYLQKIIEQVTGESLEQVCQQLVFEPLGMASSSFLNKPDLRSRTANGHIRSIVPIIVFIVPFAVAFLLTFLVGLLVFRFVNGKWRPNRKLIIIVFFIAFLVLFIATYFLFKSLILEFWWLMLISSVAFGTAWLTLILVGRYVFSLLSKKVRLRLILNIAWCILIFVGLVLIAIQITNIPVPKWPPLKAHAAGTMRTTVDDLSKFLLELVNPQYLSEEMATQLRTPQVSPSQDISWGLGIGIQHSDQGDALWQWGQTLDFQSVMVIYPEHNFGVVVFSNSDFLRPLIVFDVAHRALGGKFDGILKASRLEFNR